VGWAGAGHGEGVGLRSGLRVGLASVEVGGVLFTADLVVQGQGVASGGVAVACGGLPPEACAVFDAGDAQCAAQ
jgi:hypothetical protein